MARSTGSVTASIVGVGAPSVMPSTNLVTLSSLMASRRPTFICSSLNAVSTPGRAAIAQ